MEESLMEPPVRSSVAKFTSVHLPKASEEIGGASAY
jgi:hypothetical protein